MNICFGSNHVIFYYLPNVLLKTSQLLFVSHKDHVCAHILDLFRIFYLEFFEGFQVKFARYQGEHNRLGRCSLNAIHRAPCRILLLIVCIDPVQFRTSLQV